MSKTKNIGNLALAPSHNYVAAKLKSNKYKEIDITKKQLYRYMNVLHHTEEEAYISLMKKFAHDKVQRWSLDTQEITKLQRFIDVKDFYCSVNSMFCAGRHSSKYIKTLNALIIDLDYYKTEELKDLTPIQVLQLMNMELDYPEPSFVISSGAGMYLIWLLETTYATDTSKRFWSKLEQELVNLFNGFGVDEKVKDAARVLRMISSKHSRTNKRVSFIVPEGRTINQDFLNPIRYELSDFANLFWGEKYITEQEPAKPIKPKTKKKTIVKKVVQLKNLLSLNYSRCKDIETLVKLREDEFQEGIREQLLYLYRLHLMYGNISEEISLNMTLALNSKLKDPLDDDEVILKTKNVVGAAKTYERIRASYKENSPLSLNKMLSMNGAYIYKNKTLIDTLKITQEEQKHMTTLIDTQEKKHRKDIRNKEFYKENKAIYQEKYQEKLKNEGKLTRNEKNEIIRNQIKQLLTNDMKQQDIAKELQIGLSTVKRHIKYIKENQ